MYNINMKTEDIKLHYSLLPAFDCENPIKEAFISGVKVSGVTILDQSTGKIIAQYPVLIENSTHFDEFEKEIKKTGKILYDKVLECIEQDKVFEFSDLFKNCTTGCNGCKGCH